MTNLEELKEAESNLRIIIESLEGTIDNSSLLTIMASTYLPSIAKSLAIIADKMSEEKEMTGCFFDNYSNPKFATEEIIKDWLDNHKDEVIQRAAEVIAEKMYKSTKVRQSIIAKCGEEVNDN